MKISELFEENTYNNLCEPVLTYTLNDFPFDKDKDYTKYFNEKFKDLINFKLSEIYLNYDNEAISFYFKILPNEFQQFNKVEKALDTFLGKEYGFDYSEGYVIFHTIPTIPITVCSSYDFRLRCSNIDSLKDIDKFFPKITSLYLITLQQNTGLLPLLKCPKLKTIHISIIDNSQAKVGLSPNGNKLSTIINKYLPLGNILKCQKELIQNGFKDYAK